MNKNYNSIRAIPELQNARIIELSIRLGNNIRTLRQERGWDILDLAFYANLSEKSVENLEKGTDSNPTIKTLISLSIAFGVSVSVLIGEQNR